MKNKLFFLIAVFVFVNTCYSQSDSLSSVVNPEKTAEFKGGLNGWTKFLEKNLDPEFMRKSGAPAGRYTTIGNFLIDSVGNVSDIRIMRDPGYGAADEFKRMLRLSSKSWIPAYNNGKAVPYRHTQSLTLIN